MEIVTNTKTIILTIVISIHFTSTSPNNLINDSTTIFNTGGDILKFNLLQNSNTTSGIELNITEPPDTSPNLINLKYDNNITLIENNSTVNGSHSIFKNLNSSLLSSDIKKIRFRRSIIIGTTTRKTKKYDRKIHPPPYKWTYDPTRRTVDIFPPNASHKFPFAIAFFNTEEAIENYYREKSKPPRNFSNYKGPQLEYYPNGTIKKTYHRYSFKGNDNVSEEAQFHRRCCQEIEEYYLQNMSISADDEHRETPNRALPTAVFTRRLRLRTRAKYKGWTFGTPLPGVSWSPGVYVNLFPSDFIYESDIGLDGAGKETIEQYFDPDISSIDYNDSIHKLPDEVQIEDLPSKYNSLIERTPPDFYQLFNTDKSHYGDGLSGDLPSGVIR